ncbi:TIGR03619 family F420-dependent LLM class oxidoreductase [Sphingobium sufflavum]|uniref:TIGR03619 family F420-dependent LLM class oxidoreductase n=1 Tax=Sphingobium sufflavum TaxID=1129547 RepID=UPI001F342EC6|nr:TIGR03619 family F420-dependent LLM class oxidoreductase [Sphingobium sufflavum]MCE7795452.1 TIGR03619 family F420-dependent LLM class oxidoreductase [Sphingobium sufflavum]
MKINCPLPFDHTDAPAEFGTMEAVIAIGQAVEKAGFNAGLVTDHPVPTGRWLDAGGHHAQAPFVMLSLLAAHTKTLRLQTGILVLPYRNPFIVARDITTLDSFSGGRVTLSVGAGYLKGEYRALGVDFEKRNELMDEYIQAIRLATSGEEFTFEGDGYQAFGNRIIPGSPQTPHLPIYVGGNAKRAIRRVVDMADGWNPFFTMGGGVNSNTTRTAEITNEDDLKAAIDYMKDYAAKVGRAQLPEIVLGGVNKPGEVLTSQEIVDRIGTYRELGVSTAGVTVKGATRAEWLEDVARIGEEVIAKVQ